MAILPRSPGRPVVGQLFEVMKRGMFPVAREHWLEHGDAFAFSVGSKEIAAFVHPDAVEAMLVTGREDFIKGSGYDQIRLLVGDGVLTAEGEQWKQQRRTIQPCMNRSFLVGFVQPMVEAAVDMVEDWAHREVTVLDVYPRMLHLALRILGQTLFSIDLSQSANVSTAAFTVALEELSRRGNTIFAPPLSWPTPGNLRLRKALRTLDAIVYEMIDQRAATKAAGDPGPADLISLLLDHRGDDGRPLDRRLVHDEIITMFLAGHETTALALTWTWYLLSMYPEAEAELHEEVDRVLAGRLPTVDDLPRLEATKRILQESMRVMPPVWSGGRTVARDTELWGYEVREGAMAMLLPYFTHRHPDFWERPEAFVPARFETSNVRGRHKYAYFPFSAGPRMCVGNHFTMIEAQLVLAVVAQRVRFDLRPGHLVERDHQITMRPRHGMQMLLHPRSPSITVVDPHPRLAASC
ncbi:cytochrome P450 [Paraliomyxa miuraensis]|uniref:cytochrome P450 n=1 Tax=Paraliomyxa miuraensis TaxID=376150 RepID=UPI002254B9A0|nr:cytochrome P450 [Paraliomyxa miuraensis]MCX4244705.1 cytochrome P450 [Paraliomyxa miuraensis]